MEGVGKRKTRETRVREKGAREQNTDIKQGRKREREKQTIMENSEMKTKRMGYGKNRRERELAWGSARKRQQSRTNREA